METLIVNLSAVFVDNPVGPSASTKVEILLENSSGTISIEDREEGSRSTHKFTIKNASILGLGDNYNLAPEQACHILALSCSLVNPRILFTPIQVQFLSTAVDSGTTPTPQPTVEAEADNHLKVTVSEGIRITESVSTKLGTKIRLDEVQVLLIASKLLSFNIFDSNNRNLQELNVIEAVKRYKEAMMSVDGIACYCSLFQAFEKAINADQERKDKAFDLAASSLAGLQDSEVANLRLFYNRIKHALRNPNDLAKLKSSESKFGELARTLKKATDKAILARI